ncbi:MAG: TIGR00730 family Rossman fold protein [Nitriliruptor sp.]|nr:MAG: TIGR00730 family Rossman fold protein [Nitriliruptor sp.]
MRVAVYTSSSDAVDEPFRTAAVELAGRLADRGDQLIYGGTAVGVMGVLADAMRGAGGHVTGVLPQLMADRGLADADCDELVVTDDMAGRKQQMISRADAFVALPGGFGTLEELLEVLTLKQLGYHAKPIVLLDLDGFYQPLLGVFETLFARGFARPEYAGLYRVAPDVDAVCAALDDPGGPAVPLKRF